VFEIGLTRAFEWRLNNSNCIIISGGSVGIRDFNPGIGILGSGNCINPEILIYQNAILVLKKKQASLQ